MAKYSKLCCEWRNTAVCFIRIAVIVLILIIYANIGMFLGAYAAPLIGKSNARRVLAESGIGEGRERGKKYEENTQYLGTNISAKLQRIEKGVKNGEAENGLGSNASVEANEWEGILFFAGEATAWDSNPQTVHGAVDSGRRAAKVILGMNCHGE